MTWRVAGGLGRRRGDEWGAVSRYPAGAVPRRAAAGSGGGNGAANRRHGVWCRPIGRHGVWCLQLQARYMVPAKAGTVSCRALPSGAVIRAAFPGGQCRICFFAPGFWQGRRGSPAGGAKPCLPLEACAAGQNRAADWRRRIGRRERCRRLADRVGRVAERDWGFSGRDAESGNADVRECGCLGACGALECGVRGLPAGPIGPAGAVPPDMVPPIGGTVPGGTVRCRAIARHGGMVPPIGGTVPGGTVRCRAIARHGEWCRQSAARCTAA